MKRIAVQIAIDQDNDLVMIANDGTVWAYRGNGRWFGYPELPQPGSPEDEFRTAEFFEPTAGSRIQEAIGHACRRASDTGKAVALYHNLSRILIRPGDHDQQTLLELWSKLRSGAIIALPKREDGRAG